MSSHQVTRFVRGQQRLDHFQGLVALMLGFSNGEATNGIAIKADFDQAFGRALAQIRVHRTLHDAEQRIAIAQHIEALA